MAYSKLMFVVMLILGILCASEAAASEAAAPTSPDETMIQRYETWMMEHGRMYQDEVEKDMRFGIFKQNVEYIDSVNQNSSRTYKLAANIFADLTKEEFQASHTGYKSSSLPYPSTASSFRYENVTAVPSSIDWRAVGAVTAVKSQGTCGKYAIPFLIFRIIFF